MSFRRRRLASASTDGTVQIYAIDIRDHRKTSRRELPSNVQDQRPDTQLGLDHVVISENSNG